MKGFCLRFYINEFQKHQGVLLYEWLLECAKKQKVPGGSAFKAIAGFGRHGIMHEEHFFELASNVPIEVVFVLSESECDLFLDLIHKENLDILYAKTQIEYGTTQNLSV